MPTAQPATAGPSRLWSTEAVRCGERLDYWVGAICEAFLEMDCSSREAEAFGGRLASRAVEQISVNQVIASTQDVYRTPAAIARSRRSHFYLIGQADRPWHVRQGGQVAHLRPGDVALVDAAEPYELHFPQGVHCMSLQLPRAWVLQWLRTPESVGPRVAWRDQGWGRSLSALAAQLARDPDSAAAMPAEMFTQHLGALLVAALEPAPVAAVSERRLHQRLLALMSEQLDQHGLRAEALAQEVGVSLRTLHRSFAAADATFAGTLRRLRIERAEALLAQPRLAHLSVAEIGRRCGFADASHFVREYQRQRGITPGARRRQA
ncbi:helix-turn-helix domain-containing protein [uncultured Pseudacidovorax sp.]|uniref:AraC-like ligand-binding domain-containing protein n=1 Tax=uncultured Pseudacidovorax sp. TaxID=679313 RepID=UPI0025D6069C|nr:helix-turn-helix domain-containing protein [uncultured Pseudacidovorax sp.]